MSQPKRNRLPGAWSPWTIVLVLAVFLFGGWLYYSNKVDNLTEERDSWMASVERDEENISELRDEIESLETRVAELREQVRETEPEPQPQTGRCLRAKEIRQELVSRSDPDIHAEYFDAQDIASQGICCGPGYVISTYTPFGEPAVIPPRPSFGEYHIAAVPLGPNDDVTFTPRQWLTYSIYEALRCRLQT